jgi:hypothetical protein
VSNAPENMRCATQRARRRQRTICRRGCQWWRGGLALSMSVCGTSIFDTPPGIRAHGFSENACGTRYVSLRRVCPAPRKALPTPWARVTSNATPIRAGHSVQNTLLPLPTGTMYRGPAKHRSSIGEVLTACRDMFAPAGRSGTRAGASGCSQHTPHRLGCGGLKPFLCQNVTMAYCWSPTLADRPRSVA